MTIVDSKELEKAQIIKRVQDHYDEARQDFLKDQIVGCFLQGSQNYGLQLPNSDVDTKLIVLPSFKDIALSAKPVSTTHIRANDEHTDWKDIRLYMETFRKQNLNFLEILFTDYKIIHPDYEPYWDILVKNREGIARMNPYRAVKSMQGIAKEKYHAMEHRYPAKAAIIDAYGYDGKQVHHLMRVDDYLERYIAGERYEDCLKPTPRKRPRMMDYKMLDKIPLEEAREEARAVLAHVDAMAAEFCAEVEEKEDEVYRTMLQEVSYGIMRIAVQKELRR